MRSTRFLFAIVLAAVPLLVAGCSEKAARITGNERLLRGTGGLGTTLRADTTVDRDTYVPPAPGPLKGSTLLVGRRDSYEARSLFKVSLTALPDPTDTSNHYLSLTFGLAIDGSVDEDLPIDVPLSLHQAAAPWDTTSVTWPGPPLGTQLASAVDDVAPFTLALTPSTATVLRADTTGFVLVAEPGSGVRGFVAGSGFFQAIYYRNVSGRRDTTTLTIPIPTDLTIHTPLAPASGTETTLLLGGLFRSEVLLRAPVRPPPEGFSINSAAFVGYVQSGAFPLTDSVEIRAYRIRTAWTEATAATDSLGLDTTPLATRTYRVRTGTDSLVVQIPSSVAREWSLNDAANQGILLRVIDSFRAPAIVLFSRESADPPIFRVSTTEPPPGRFAAEAPR